MAAAVFRHQHVRIDQAKLDRARKILSARTDTEALNRAPMIVVSEADIDATLRKTAGKGRIKKVFR